VTVSGSTVIQDFRALCYGDVDASNAAYKDNENTTSNVVTSISLDLTNTQSIHRPDDHPVHGSCEGKSTIEVYTMLGFLVGTIDDPDDYEGVHMLYFDRNGLTPGLYLYTIKLKTSDDTLLRPGNADKPVLIYCPGLKPLL